MTRTLTAAAVALALALSPVAAAPARAGSNQDVGRFIAGAITLMIFSKALSDTLEGKVGKNRVPPKKRKVRFSRFLPAQCLFDINTRKGPVGVYGKTCLNELMYNAKRLPQRCERTIRTRYGRRAKVYEASCLRRNGYFPSRFY